MMDIFNLLNNYKQVEFKSGEYIFHEGDYCDYIGIIKKGIIYINTFIAGKINTIKVLKENDIFGNNLIFSSNPFFLGDAIANKTTTIILIKKKDLCFLLKTNESFFDYYMAYNADENIKSRNQIKILSQSSIKNKLLCYLELNNKNNVTYIDSVTILSKYLSVPRPSLSRELTNLENEGYIKRNKKSILLLNEE